MNSAIVVGGTNMSEQRGDLRAGVEIVVATPGRFIDHLQQVGASLPRSPAWQSILPWLTALLTGTLVSNAALMCWYSTCPGKHSKHRVQQASTLLTLKSL